jgi:hypothetical protein
MDEVIATLPPEPPYSGEEEGPERAAWELWLHEHTKLQTRADEHATIAIIFSCAACELYINDAAARLLGHTYFKKHIDRLDLLSKWVVAPRLICGHQVDRGGRAYELLKQLVGVRNDLMHPKSVPFSIEQFQRTTENASCSRFDLARDAIEALDRLADEAEKFDPLLGGATLRDHEEHLRRLLERAKSLAPRQASAVAAVNPTASAAGPAVPGPADATAASVPDDTADKLASEAASPE